MYIELTGLGGKKTRFEHIKKEKLSMKMNLFSQKDCDIHNQRPFFVYKMEIPQKWQILLKGLCKAKKKVYIFLLPPILGN